MAMTIAAAMTALVAEYEEGEIVDPLSQRFTLSVVLEDLARIAGEELPAEVGAAAEALRDEPIVPLTGNIVDIVELQRRRAAIELRQTGPLHWA